MKNNNKIWLDDLVIKYAREFYPDDTEDWSARQRALALCGRVLGEVEQNFLSQEEIKKMIDDLNDDGIIHTSEIKKVLSPEKENDLEKLKTLRQSLQSINENIEWLEDIQMDMEDEIGVIEQKLKEKEL